MLQSIPAAVRLCDINPIWASLFRHDRNMTCDALILFDMEDKIASKKSFCSRNLRVHTFAISSIWDPWAEFILRQISQLSFCSKMMALITHCYAIFIFGIIKTHEIFFYCLTHWVRNKMAAIFADDIFICISLNENFWMSNKISLRYVP